MKNTMYIYNEESTIIIQSKANWLKWYNLNGNKENFASAEDWFQEMVSMQILNEV